MKTILAIALAIISSICTPSYAQSPYAIFGDNSRMLDAKRNTIPNLYRIEISDNDGASYYVEFDFVRGTATVYNPDGDIVSQDTIRGNAKARFTTVDPEAEKCPHLSPYNYCGNDPVNCIDPTGCIIEGATKKDAVMAVEDLRNLFSDEEFSYFRSLIVQSGKNKNGKTLASISSEDLLTAFNGHTLNTDQQALVDIVVNTINSNDIHKIEYIQGKGVLSKKATNAFLPSFMSGELGSIMPLIIEKNGGLPAQLIVNVGGGGATTKTDYGSYSLIILGGEHPNGRAVTTGHELFGHGRSLALGYEYNQNVEAIRTENLILRILGIPFINTGINHGNERTPIPNPSLLPSFR